MEKPSEKLAFEFRDKIESWIEGIFDTISIYLRTVLLINFRPCKAAGLLQAEDSGPNTLTEPGIFMVLSYFVMAWLIKDVDFSDPVFALNLARVLNAIGVLEAARTLDVQKVLLGIFPAIGLLFFFCYVSHVVFFVFREGVDPVKLRRRYSYLLGDSFLLLGIVCGGYWLLVRPFAARSWWLGPAIHGLTMFPMVGVVMLALSPLPAQSPTLKGFLTQLLARNLPWAILIFIVWYSTGAFGFLNYLKHQ